MNNVLFIYYYTHTHTHTHTRLNIRQLTDKYVFIKYIFTYLNYLLCILLNKLHSHLHARINDTQVCMKKN